VRSEQKHRQVQETKGPGSIREGVKKKKKKKSGELHPVSRKYYAKELPLAAFGIPAFVSMLALVDTARVECSRDANGIVAMLRRLAGS